MKEKSKWRQHCPRGASEMKPEPGGGEASVCLSPGGTRTLTTYCLDAAPKDLHSVPETKIRIGPLPWITCDSLSLTDKCFFSSVRVNYDSCQTTLTSSWLSAFRRPWFSLPWNSLSVLRGSVSPKQRSLFSPASGLITVGRRLCVCVCYACVAFFCLEMILSKL